jgi:uncharacterized protein YfkK (UPF0435 family)
MDLLVMTFMFAGVDDVVAFEGEQYSTDLSKSDYETMPNELREIYDMCGKRDIYSP